LTPTLTSAPSFTPQIAGTFDFSRLSAVTPSTTPAPPAHNFVFTFSANSVPAERQELLADLESRKDTFKGQDGNDQKKWKK